MGGFPGAAQPPKGVMTLFVAGIPLANRPTDHYRGLPVPLSKRLSETP